MTVIELHWFSTLKANVSWQALEGRDVHQCQGTGWGWTTAANELEGPGREGAERAMVSGRAARAGWRVGGPMGVSPVWPWDTPPVLGGLRGSPGRNGDELSRDRQTCYRRVQLALLYRWSLGLREIQELASERESVLSDCRSPEPVSVCAHRGWLRWSAKPEVL